MLSPPRFWSIPQAQAGSMSLRMYFPKNGIDQAQFQGMQNGSLLFPLSVAFLHPSTSLYRLLFIHRGKERVLLLSKESDEQMEIPRTWLPRKRRPSAFDRRQEINAQSWTELALCLVAQSCPTLCDPVDRSSPGSSVHGGSPGKDTGVGCHALLQV